MSFDHHGLSTSGRRRSRLHSVVSHKGRRAVSLSVAVAALVGGLSAPASASHFRASNATLSYSSGTLTWVVNTAWRKNADDSLIYSGAQVAVTDSNGAAVNVPVSDPATVSDTTDPLYDKNTNTVTADISGLLGTPGTYQMYVENCCRVDGVQNTSGNDSFSQSVSFTVEANGDVDLPPTSNTPALYALIPVSGSNGLTIDYRATDPEGSAITYSPMTDPDGPDYGATALPCSSFTGGILTLNAGLCAPGDDFATLYQAGFFYAFKARATDASGNHSEVDTLLRVPTQPQPYVGNVDVHNGTATFDIGLDDQDTYVDSYVVTCTNVADATDVMTVTSPTTPLVISGMTSGASYTCDVSATNGLGTGTQNGNNVVVPSYTAQAITFAQPANAHVGDTVALAATADSGLPVSYSSSTPSVCSVSGSTVTVLASGTCTIAADQSGDTTYGAAPTVTRSFSILPAAPAPAPVSSNGTGGSTQSVTVPVPSGDTLTLVDGSGHDATVVTVPSVGTYALDTATGTITFVPAAGFSGTAPALPYKITDGFGQSVTATYTVVVAKPAAPTAGTISTTGGSAQQVSVTVPAGDTITLVDAAGNATNTVTVKGQGTYTLDPTTGVITFVPAATFHGQATPVSYRVADGYGQSVTGTYQPVVSGAAKPVTAKATAAKLLVLRGHVTTVPVAVKLSGAKASKTVVTLLARVGGHTVVVGTGRSTIGAGKASAIVKVQLNKLGRSLASSVGGVTVTAKAAVQPRGTTAWKYASAPTRVVVAKTLVARPVFFDTGEYALRASDKAFLNSLRPKLAGVHSVACIGYTDNRSGAAFNKALGLHRAKAACAYLLRGTGITSVLYSYGDSRPQASNADSHGQALNRRSSITLKY